MKLEAVIQKECVAYLRARHWFVKRFTGNAYQYGVPDVMAYHKDYGTRWIDFKPPKGGRLTQKQIIEWPQWEAAGIGIWIITAANDTEYAKLWQAPNWREWWKPSYEIDLNQLLSEVSLDE